MQIAIVTDDLTSATDGSVALAEAGWAVRVNRGTVRDTAAVVSVDMASRTSAREEAIRRATAVGGKLADVPIVVSQFDSTLRGHVAAETLALFRASGRRRVVVAPAFPSAGRFTINGCQFVDGVPVADSAYARDPLNPVQCSDVVALFRAEGVSASLSAGDAPIVLVRDARTETELDLVIKEYADRPDVLLAGSTGLMRALARSGPKPQGSAPGLACIQPSQKALVVVGSVNERSRQQLEFLTQGRSPPVFTIETSDNVSLTANRIAAGFETVPVVAVTTARTPGDPHNFARKLSGVTRELIEASVIDALIVTGGETFGAILDCLGTTSLDVLREIEPGVPLCRFERQKPVLAISKAGGFGSPEVFSKALQVLFQGPVPQPPPH